MTPEIPDDDANSPVGAQVYREQMRSLPFPSGARWKPRLRRGRIPSLRNCSSARGETTTPPGLGVGPARSCGSGNIAGRLDAQRVHEPGNDHLLENHGVGPYSHLSTKMPTLGINPGHLR